MADDAARGERRLVLVGGGHAHVFVLKDFAERQEHGVQVVLVAKDRRTPYSGMLPGHVAGFYPREALEIDLAPLADGAGAELMEDEAVAVDVEARTVRLKSGAVVPYDVLSIDIGITPDLSAIQGAEHGVAVKPIGDFLDKWQRLKTDALRADGPRRIAVVGGGVAGLCLVFAVAATLRREGRTRGRAPEEFSFALVSAAHPPELNAGMRRRVARALRRHGIEVHQGETATRIDSSGVALKSGGFVPADRVLLSTQAKPPEALADAALARDERGFLAIRPTLQSLSRPEVFAAGDCATMVDHPRPKSGVFAVRQGPVLGRNLRRYLRGEALEEYVPQSRHLVLLSTADGQAIGGRGQWLAFDGRFAWWLKDWIDRRFIRRFSAFRRGRRARN